MATPRRRQRAQTNTGSIAARIRCFVARVGLRLGALGKRSRRSRSFDNRWQAEAWIEKRHSQTEELILPVVDQRHDDDRPWWLEHDGPKARRSRAPVAATTFQGYRNNIEWPLIPTRGHKRLVQRTVSDLDAFANRKLADEPLDGQPDPRDALFGAGHRCPAGPTHP